MLDIFIAVPAGVLIGAVSEELLTAYSIMLNLISSIIDLIVIVPITKLSMAYTYRVLEARSHHQPSLVTDATGVGA